VRPPADPAGVHRVTRRLGRLLPVAAILTIAAAAAAPAGAKVRPASSIAPLGNEQLSNEKTLSRWATPFNLAPIRRTPGGAAIARLRYHTEDGPLEVYLVLRSKVVKKVVWLQIRIPGRPNGRTGWVRETDMGQLNVVTTFLKIDRGKLRATLYRKGRKIWSSPVGVGKASTPTPAGRFWIRERLKSLGGAYGPWAFGTSAYSPQLTDWPGGGVVGIHGTNEPQLIPGRPSHGCVRVPNSAVIRLKRLMPIGTPVQIV
jgi:L,D-transpeptidase-like protein